MFEVDASDEALFANLDWIKANEEDVDIFVKALVSVWQDMAEDPTIIARETNPDGPIGQLPPEILADLDDVLCRCGRGRALRSQRRWPQGRDGRHGVVLGGRSA